MSDISATYGPYAGLAAQAIRKRENRRVATEQAKYYGQQRGTRALEDLAKKFQLGWQPTLTNLGRRGLRSSGITNRTLADYAANYQRNLGAQNIANAEEMQKIAEQDQAYQQELDDYLEQLKYNKAMDIFETAKSIKKIK